MKCDLPKHDSLAARLVALAYNKAGRKAWAAKCKKCKEWHVYEEKDYEAAKAEKV